MSGRGGGGPSLVEPFAVWGLFAAVAAAVAATYARLPSGLLYNVDEGGIGGGLGRALVFLNFPTGLAAIAVAAVVADRLASRRSDAVALAAVCLCLVVAVPGVVEQSDLDAKPANAIPATGVLLALAASVFASTRTGIGSAAPWTKGDRLRLVAAVVLVLAAIPWSFAELGFYVSDVPVLGSVFLAGEVVSEPGHPDIRAVHLGHHHGMDGTLLALTALALSRGLGRMRRRRLRVALAAYLSLMLVYGLANALQDFWLEQLVKRGATSFELPDMLRPDLGPEWAGVLVAAAAVYAFLFRPTRVGLVRR